MSLKNKLVFHKPNLAQLASLTDVLVYFVDDSIKNDMFGELLNEITDGFIERIKNNSKFLKLKEGSFIEFHLPFPLKLDALILAKRPNNFSKSNAREIGADLSVHLDERNASIFSEHEDFLTNVLFGFEIRSYHFDKYKSEKKCGSV